MLMYELVGAVRPSSLLLFNLEGLRFRLESYS